MGRAPLLPAHCIFTTSQQGRFVSVLVGLQSPLQMSDNVPQN